MSNDSFFLWFVMAVCALVLITLFAILDRVEMNRCRDSAYPRNAIYVEYTDTCYLVKDDYSLVPFKKENRAER